MPPGKLVVYTKPVSASVEANFNAWYDEVHVPEVCRTLGIAGAERYVLHGRQIAGSRQYDEPYMAIYRLDDIANAIAVLESKTDWIGSDTVDVGESFIHVYEACPQHDG